MGRRNIKAGDEYKISDSETSNSTMVQTTRQNTMCGQHICG